MDWDWGEVGGWIGWAGGGGMGCSCCLVWEGRGYCRQRRGWRGGTVGRSGLV